MTRNIDGISTPFEMLNREFAELLDETSWKRLRRRHAIAPTLASAIGAATLGLLASASAFAEPAAQASQRAQEHHACAVVLGLDPSEAPYQDCVAALDHYLPPVDPANASAPRQKANAACADIGLEQGSLAYDRCVVEIDQTLSDQQQIYR
jgi:hypothetical protein